MTELQRLRTRREAILKELAALEQMRRGSITEQYVETVRGDGTKGSRGPYVLYTFKKENKTISRRVPHGEQAPIYRRQIQAFRLFQKLVSELTVIGERISDLVVLSEAEVKKTPHSKPRKTPR